MCVHAGKNDWNTALQPCQASIRKRRHAVRHSQRLAAMWDHARPWLQLSPCHDSAVILTQQYNVQLGIKTSVGSIACCENSKLACSPLLPEVVAHEAKGPVRVVFLGIQSSIVHDVLEGIVHQTSSTPSILALHTHPHVQSLHIYFHMPCHLLQAGMKYCQYKFSLLNQTADHIICAASVSQHAQHLAA